MDKKTVPYTLPREWERFSWFYKLAFNDLPNFYQYEEGKTNWNPMHGKTNKKIKQITNKKQATLASFTKRNSKNSDIQKNKKPM